MYVECIKNSGGLRQAFILDKTTGHRRFMVYFGDKKSCLYSVVFALYPIIVLWLIMLTNWFP